MNASPVSQKVAGFTLLELLVAVSLAVVLAAAAVPLGRRAGEAFARATGRISSDQQVRAVYEQLAADLAAAWFRDDGRVWLAAEVIEDPSAGLEGFWQSPIAAGRPRNSALSPVGTALPRERFGPGGVWLRLFTTRSQIAPENFPSVPVAVSYRIVRRQAADGKSADYQLHRFVLRASSPNNQQGTFELGYDLSAPVYLDPGGVWLGGGANNHATVLADHVVDFGVRCYVGDPAAAEGLRLIFPLADGTGANALRSSLPPVSSASSENDGREFPELVDVFVRVLTEEGAMRISELESGHPPSDSGQSGDVWWETVFAHSRIYSRRFEVRRT